MSLVISNRSRNTMLYVAPTYAKLEVVISSLLEQKFDPATEKKK